MVAIVAAIVPGPEIVRGQCPEGSVVGWGGNYYGQTDVPTPNTGFVAVATQAEYNLGLKGDGSIAAWGNNSHGQGAVPAPNTDFVAVAAGFKHSLGLKADGSIVAWGADQPGPLVGHTSANATSQRRTPASWQSRPGCTTVLA